MKRITLNWMDKLRELMNDKEKGPVRVLQELADYGVEKENNLNRDLEASRKEIEKGNI